MTPVTIGRLSTATVHPVLPAEDIVRARSFYSDVLGLETELTPGGELYVHAGGGTSIVIYERARTKAEHTAAAFVVEDLKSTMSELRERGVRFEEYDMPGLKTIDGVAESPGEWAAWFTDSEGNIINVAQMK
jgi:predicted enzyme related to lactoylglutathione lyase